MIIKTDIYRMSFGVGYTLVINNKMFTINIYETIQKTVSQTPELKYSTLEEFNTAIEMLDDALSTGANMVDLSPDVVIKTIAINNKTQRIDELIQTKLELLKEQSSYNSTDMAWHTIGERITHINNRIKKIENE